MDIVSRSLGLKVLLLVSGLTVAAFAGLFWANSHWQRQGAVEQIDRTARRVSDMDSIRTYKELPLKSAEHVEAAEIEPFEGSTPKPDAPELSTDEAASMDDFLKNIKEILGDRITEVRLSTRLTQSPSCANPDQKSSGEGQTDRAKQLQRMRKRGAANRLRQHNNAHG